MIELPGQRLLVEEACSGINSFLFVTAFCLFYLFWRRRGFRVFLFCLPSALAFVVTGNVLRISLGAWLQFSFGIDILSGWKHELQSILLVVAYVVLVISLESLFPRRAQRPAATVPADPGASQQNPVFPIWLRLVVVLFAALGLIASVQAWTKSRETAEPLRAAGSHLPPGAAFSLPDRIGDWTRAEDGPAKVSTIESLGLSTTVWNFRRPGLQAVVAFDYPIWRYHDVAECYLRNGWEIASRDIVVPDSPAPPRFQLKMAKQSGLRGTLWFATINEKGEWIDRATVRHDLISRLGLFDSAGETTYRVQLLLVGDREPDQPAVEAATQLFDGAAAILSRQMLDQLQR